MSAKFAQLHPHFETIHILKWLLLALVIFLLLAIPAKAQTNFGEVRGQVTDASGAAIPNAKVTIKDVGTNASVTVTTSGEGLYVASALRPVEYEITVEATGFQKTTVEKVKVDTAKISTVNISLKPGSLSESVTVSGEAPLLQTYTGTVTNTVDQKTIIDTPLNGRNTLQLALILPGAAGSPGTEFSEFFTNEPLPGRELSINGGRIGSTQFFADGGNVTSVALARMSISFSPDTIQEFSVQQSNYSAQYSQAGGAIIQQTTKSGTNQYRGSAFWFHRQKALTASPFDANRSATLNYDPRPPLRRQQLGVTFGGPVWIPKVYNGKDRTFFFVSYEPTRQLASNPGGATFARVPTEAEINGDLSKTLVYFRNADGSVRSEQIAPLYRQFVRQANGALALINNPGYNPALPASSTNPIYVNRGFTMFNPNDPDPTRRGRVLVDEQGRSYVSPISARLLRELYPAPNITSAGEIANNLGANYVFFRKNEYKDDRYTVRLDHRLTDKHQLYGRWTEQPQYGNRMFRDAVQNGLISDANVSRQIMATLISTIKPTLVNELRANYVHGNFGRNFPEQLLNRDLTSEYLNIGGAGAGAPNILGYGSARFYDGGALRGVSGQTSGTGIDAVGFNSPQDVGKNKEHTYSLTDDVSWVRGNMTWKFGFAASQLQLNQANLGVGSLAGGRYNWDNTTTSDITCNNQPSGGNLPGCPATVATGDKFAGFLLGVPTGLQVQTENLSVPYYYRWMNIGAYIQNDWKVTPNLTLNIGLRYQYQSPRWEKYNRQGVLNLNRLEPNPFFLDANGQPYLAPVFEFAGVDGRSRYLHRENKLDFEPRFGFAWTPGLAFNSSKKLVIRGGYGITHATLMGNDREPIPNIGSQTFGAFRALSYILGNNDYQPPTNTATCGLALCSANNIPMQFGYNNPVLASDPRVYNIPANGLIRPGDRADDPAARPGFARQDVRYQSTGVVGNSDFITPMIQSYNLTTQYQVLGNTVLTVGYQGARGSHLFSPPVNLNRVDPFTGRMPIPGFSSGRNSGAIYQLFRTGSSSTYHALITEVERRFSRGVQFRFNYTFSRNTDDTSGGINFPIPNNSFNNATGDVPLLRNQNPYDQRSERAPAATDTPHIFNMLGFWDIPVGRGKKFLNGGGWVSHIVGDWQLSGLGRVRSGYPVTVGLGQGNSLDIGIPGGAVRPSIVPGVPLVNPDWNRDNAIFNSYVNPRAFGWPDPGTYGNAARNYTVRLPWAQTLDLSIAKRIRPWKDERRYFELRGEFFNVLNHKVYDSNINNLSLISAGSQNALLSGSIPSQTPIAGVTNRFANLTAPGVWDAIIARSQGIPTDTAIAALPGPGTGGVGCPSNAAELTRTGNTLSPACTARTIGLNGSFYRLNANTVSSRIVQLAIKFYF
jgi:hypothetical protein